MASTISSSKSTRPPNLDALTSQSDMLAGDKRHASNLRRTVSKLPGIKKKLTLPEFTRNKSATPNTKIKTRKCYKTMVNYFRKKLLNLQYKLCCQAIQCHQSDSGGTNLQQNLVYKILARRYRKGIDASRPLSRKEVKRSVKTVIKKIKAIGNKAVGNYRTMNVFSSFINARNVKLPPAITLDEHDFMGKNKDVREEVLFHAKLSRAAYKGFNTQPSSRMVPEGYSLLKADELPETLQFFYNENTGLLHAPDNLKALLIRNSDEVIIAFAGTEPGSRATTGRRDTIKADTTQWAGLFTPMYRSAAAVMKILLSHQPMNNLKFGITGHSLGGGLAQFAFTAIQGDHPDRFKPVYTFNSAGLSRQSLNGLGTERINNARGNIHNVRIKGDQISPSGKSKPGNIVKGYLLGDTLTLPNIKGRTLTAHSILTLQNVLEGFVKPGASNNSHSIYPGNPDLPTGD